MSMTAQPFVGTSDVAAPGKARKAKVNISSADRASDGLSLRHVPRKDFDGAIANFDGTCQEMTVAFASSRWPEVGLEPVLFFDGDEPVAAALVMIQRLPLGVASLAVVKLGPALREEGAVGAQEIYGQAIDLLMRDYAKERGMMLSVLPRAPLAGDEGRYEALLERGFKAGSGLSFPMRYVVSLRQSDEELRKSFAQKWRYHLNKSQKQDLSFEHASADQLPEFDALYQAMTDRKRFPDHSAYDSVAHLFKSSVEAIRPELFFVRKDGETVAGAIIFKAGNTTVYLYGATNDQALPLRAGYFLHWHIIRWLRDNTEAEWYDLGGTDGFQGLHQFKKGMVGSAGQMTPVPPLANYAVHLRARIFGTAAYAARDAFAYTKQRIERLRSDLATPTQQKPESADTSRNSSVAE